MKCRITNCGNEATEGDLCNDCFSELYLSEPGQVGPLFRAVCVVLAFSGLAGVGLMLLLDKLLNWMKAGL